MSSFNLDDVLADECSAPECLAPPLEAAPFPLCTAHYVAVVRHFNQSVRSNGLAIDEWAAVHTGRSLPLDPVEPPIQPYVYFVRFSDRIKIGTSIDPMRRLAQLPVDELLALIPGDGYVERQWHDKYQAQRTVGEWFRITPTMLEEIQALGIAA